MITIELKERVRKKWDFSIQVIDEIPEYMSSKEFKKIADVITSACNQLTEIRNDHKSVSESDSETH